MNRTLEIEKKETKQNSGSNNGLPRSNSTYGSPSRLRSLLVRKNESTAKSKDKTVSIKNESNNTMEKKQNTRKVLPPSKSPVRKSVVKRQVKSDMGYDMSHLREQVVAVTYDDLLYKGISHLFHDDMSVDELFELISLYVNNCPVFPTQESLEFFKVKEQDDVNYFTEKMFKSKYLDDLKKYAANIKQNLSDKVVFYINSVNLPFLNEDFVFRGAYYDSVTSIEKKEDITFKEGTVLYYSSIIYLICKKLKENDRRNLEELCSEFNSEVSHDENAYEALATFNALYSENAADVEFHEFHYEIAKCNHEIYTTFHPKNRFYENAMFHRINDITAKAAKDQTLKRLDFSLELFKVIEEKYVSSFFMYLLDNFPNDEDPIFNLIQNNYLKFYECLKERFGPNYVLGYGFVTDDDNHDEFNKSILIDTCVNSVKTGNIYYMLEFFPAISKILDNDGKYLIFKIMKKLKEDDEIRECSYYSDLLIYIYDEQYPFYKLFCESSLIDKEKNTTDPEYFKTVDLVYYTKFGEVVFRDADEIINKLKTSGESLSGIYAELQEVLGDNLGRIPSTKKIDQMEENYKNINKLFKYISTHSSYNIFIHKQIVEKILNSKSAVINAPDLYASFSRYLGEFSDEQVDEFFETVSDACEDENETLQNAKSAVKILYSFYVKSIELNKFNSLFEENITAFSLNIENGEFKDYFSEHLADKLNDIKSGEYKYEESEESELSTEKSSELVDAMYSCDINALRRRLQDESISNDYFNTSIKELVRKYEDEEEFDVCPNRKETFSILIDDDRINLKNAKTLGIILASF